MTHKTRPEEAVSVNEGKAVGVSLLTQHEGTLDYPPFECTMGWALWWVWIWLGWLGLGAVPSLRQSCASHRQAAQPGALPFTFTIHMSNLHFSALARL